MKKSTAVTIAVVTFCLFGLCGLFGTLGLTYNGLVRSRNEVDAKWAQVDNQLKRRADLIPNLVATVKGYAVHEQAVIDSVTAARAQLAGAGSPGEKAAANGQLDSALSRLLVIVENYPNLKADGHFRDLMAELSGTENRIAVARMDYNETVKAFNNKTQEFPTMIIAGAWGFGAREYFQVNDADRQVPQVDFSR